MARNDRTADEFDAIAQELSEAVESLKATAALMRTTKLPAALIHGSTTLNRFLPAVLQWVDKASIDVKAQARAYLNGSMSAAEYQKQLNARNKLAAAKKKVPTKKKP